MTHTDINWETWRAETFTRIHRIIEGRNCSKFELSGYKHLEMTLFLDFDDAVETFVFTPLVEGTYTHVFKPGWPK